MGVDPLDFSDLDVPPSASPTGIDDHSSAAEIRQRASIANGGEQATVDCPRCKGTGIWRGYARSFPCRSCGGNGTTTTRKAGAFKAQQTRQTRIEEWQMRHVDLLSNLRRIADWNSFAGKMLEAVEDYGTLTDKQVDACRAMLAKIATRREERRQQASTEAVTRSGDIGVERINQLFETASASGLKKPQFRTEHLVIKPAKKHAGVLYVTDRRVTDRVTGQGGAYVGKIVNGRFEARREAEPDTLRLLCEISEDPMKAAVEYGRSTGTCCCCGRELTDPASVEAGIGPICVTKWGL